MKAAYIEQTGPPDAIRYGDLPDPQIEGNQVLVKVGAVAVNPIDTYIRSGAIQMQIPLPFVVGCDLAGTVEAVGDQVRTLKPGDRVWASNQGVLGRQGSFSEYAAVDEQWLYPTPDGVPDEVAAAIALVGITGHLGLVREAQLAAGETLFINGGTGGVGATVVQMAKALGAKVITTAGTDEKVAKAKDFGADVAINYHASDLDEQIKAAAPNGINLWWETLREPNFERTIPFLAPRGRMIVMAGRDARPVLPVGPFYVKECRLMGFVMFAAPADIQRAASEDINGWLAGGKLRPCIDRVIPLSEAAEAHRLQEDSTVKKSGELTGKIVLKP